MCVFCCCWLVVSSIAIASTRLFFILFARSVWKWRQKSSKKYVKHQSKKQSAHTVHTQLNFKCWVFYERAPICVSLSVITIFVWPELLAAVHSVVWYMLNGLIRGGCVFFCLSPSFLFLLSTTILFSSKSVWLWSFQFLVPILYCNFKFNLKRDSLCMLSLVFFCFVCGLILLSARCFILFFGSLSLLLLVLMLLASILLATLFFPSSRVHSVYFSYMFLLVVTVCDNWPTQGIMTELL